MVRMANESEVALDERNRIYSFVQSMMEQEDEDRFEEMLEEFRNCFHDPNMSKARKAFGKYMLKSIETINQHSRIPHLAHRRARAEGETYEGGDTSPSSLFPLNWTNNVAESTNSLLKRAVDHEVKSFGEVITVKRNIHTSYVHYLSLISPLFRSSTPSLGSCTRKCAMWRRPPTRLETTELIHHCTTSGCAPWSGSTCLRRPDVTLSQTCSG